MNWCAAGVRGYLRMRSSSANVSALGVLCACLVSNRGSVLDFESRCKCCRVSRCTALLSSRRLGRRLVCEFLGCIVLGSWSFVLGCGCEVITASAGTCRWLVRCQARQVLTLLVLLWLLS